MAWLDEMAPACVIVDTDDGEQFECPHDSCGERDTIVQVETTTLWHSATIEHIAGKRVLKLWTDVNPSSEVQGFKCHVCNRPVTVPGGIQADDPIWH